MAARGSTPWIMAGLVGATMAFVYLLPRDVERTAGVGLPGYLLHLPTRTLGDLASIAGHLPPDGATLHIVFA